MVEIPHLRSPRLPHPGSPVLTKKEPKKTAKHGSQGFKKEWMADGNFRKLKVFFLTDDVKSFSEMFGLRLECFKIRRFSEKHAFHHIVGGFNPFENYAPGIWVKMKKSFKPP